MGRERRTGQRDVLSASRYEEGTTSSSTNQVEILVDARLSGVLVVRICSTANDASLCTRSSRLLQPLPTR